MSSIWLRAMFSVLLVLFFAPCGAKDLSREGAARAIATSPQMKDYRSNVLLQRDALEKGRELGWWQESGGIASNFSPEMQQEATKYGQTLMGQSYLQLKQEAPIAVTVTGLTGGDKGGQSRIAEFQWSYSSLPRLVRKVAMSGGSGVAAFHLYDDGWRLVEVLSVTPTGEPHPLSEAEKAELKQELAAAKESRQARARAISNARQRALAENLLVKEFNFEITSNRGRDVQKYVVAITNASLLLRPLPSYETNKTAHIWFGAISSVGFDSSKRVMIAKLHCNSGLGTVVKFYLPSAAQPEFFQAFERAFSSWKLPFNDFARPKAGCGSDEVGMRATQAFEAPPGASASTDPKSTQLIGDVQTALEKRNLYAGPITGVMDEWTVEYIKRFQSIERISPDGRLTRETLDALGVQTR